MSVAALYDIHGNLPALLAVLAAIEQDDDVTDIVVGGDVLWGPMQSECLALLREVGASVIAGNCEHDVLHPQSDTDIWCHGKLGAAELQWVEEWPTTLRLEEEGLGTILLCHATPGDIEGVITSVTPDEDVESAIAGVDVAVVVCGHTHVQFDRRLPSGRRIVNPGSVGLPYESSAGAFWAKLGPDVHLRRTEYDTESAIAAFTAIGYPESTPNAGWFDGIFSRSLRAEVAPAEATAFFESRRSVPDASD